MRGDHKWGPDPQVECHWYTPSAPLVSAGWVDAPPGTHREPFLRITMHGRVRALPRLGGGGRAACGLPGEPREPSVQRLGDLVKCISHTPVVTLLLYTEPSKRLEKMLRF